jgi:Xaa-Pro aminopeptidase
MPTLTGDPDTLPALHATFDALAEPVDGWLLFDFRGLNPIMAAVVGADVVGSRRAYVYVPRAGVPTAVVHAIDAELWRAWPAAWPKVVWVRREELARHLAALVGGRTVAMEYSPRGDVPYGDYVPAGTLELVRATGATVTSSAELVSRWCSAWTAADLASHRRAATLIAEIAHAAFARVGEGARSAAPVTEHALATWVREAIERAGLVTDSGPSVSYGANAARSHYDPPAEGSEAIVPGKLLLLDLWATEPGGVYADQTWMAAVGAPSARATAVWTVVRDARDAALDLLRARLAAGEAVAGAEADRAARAVIVAAGHAEHIIGRTGHSIDRMGLHGYGPTIDDTESFDGRQILPGVGFSVEPGVYVPGEIGVRSEVNAHAHAHGLEVTPVEYQRELVVV